MISLFELSAWKNKILQKKLGPSSIQKIKSSNIQKPELVQKYGNLIAYKKDTQALKNNTSNMATIEKNRNKRYALYQATK